VALSRPRGRQLHQTPEQIDTPQLIEAVTLQVDGDEALGEHQQRAKLSVTAGSDISRCGRERLDLCRQERAVAQAIEVFDD
jgi:hypothetical protein